MNSRTNDEGLLAQILDWLRAGYPDGVPPKDYFPLLALLKKQLNTDELDRILGLLLAGRPDVVDREQVEAAIVEVTRCEPSEDDLRQVAAKLAAGGWPLTGFHD
ncbi:DUF3349 domain-containing protein [Nocardia elegans]|uniref:DUF3349 domain-containing protein n=1 Tax=Nocardia elegans TaxID=300029 RepID=A0ABW6TFV9_9NOCA|nr:DUF3349 domain-containing protein [Nocardia elegans]MBF6446308.1 DUF3349 domain-containing protein [Nocardia elegans]